MKNLLKYCKTLILSFLMLGCESQAENEADHSLPEEIQGEITNYYKRQLSDHLNNSSGISKDSIVLLGDSLLEAMPSYQSTIVNYGIKQDTSYGLLKRVSHYRNLHKAKAIVVAIGVNDIWRGRDKESIAHNIELILNTLPDNIPVLVYGLLPVDERVGWKGWNKRILEINRAISLKISKPHVYYTELQPIFSNEKGNLRAGLHRGDGVHLNDEGYSLWWKHIKANLAR